MTVQFPDELEVTCDGCGTSANFDVTEYSGNPSTVGVDDSTLEAQNWGVEGDETFCPECKDKE